MLGLGIELGEGGAARALFMGLGSLRHKSGRGDGAKAELAAAESALGMEGRRRV